MGLANSNVANFRVALASKHTPCPFLVIRLDVPFSRSTSVVNNLQFPNETGSGLYAGRGSSDKDVGAGSVPRTCRLNRYLGSLWRLAGSRNEYSTQPY